MHGTAVVQNAGTYHINWQMFAEHVSALEAKLGATKRYKHPCLL